MGKGGKFFPRRRKSNFTAKFLNTFAAHCAHSLKIWVTVNFNTRKSGTEKNWNSFLYYLRYMLQRGSTATCLGCRARLRKSARNDDLYSGIRRAYNIGFTRELA